MPEAASPAFTSTPPVSPRPKVLVVDDELGPRESITYLLQDEFEVVAVDRVDRGLDLIERESFAVVVMDIRMPQKNGIQGLEAMRKIDPEVSIIMMTGYGALATAQAAISLGANESMSSPAAISRCAFSLPSAMVKAISCTAVAPESCMWYPDIDIELNLGIAAEQ